MTPVLIPRAVFMRPLLHSPIDQRNTDVVRQLRNEQLIPRVTSNLEVEFGGDIIMLRSALPRQSHRAPRLFMGSLCHEINRFLELTPKFADNVFSITYEIEYEDDAGAVKTLNLHTELVTVDKDLFEISLHEGGARHHVFFDEKMTQRLLERGAQHLIGFDNTWLRTSDGYA